jgi:hypothetical protein
LLAHARILGCETRDLESNLLSAIGHIGLQLEHFPEERYVAMAADCVRGLRGALGRRA